MAYGSRGIVLSLFLLLAAANARAASIQRLVFDMDATEAPVAFSVDYSQPEIDRVAGARYCKPSFSLGEGTFSQPAAFLHEGTEVLVTNTGSKTILAVLPNGREIRLASGIGTEITLDGAVASGEGFDKIGAETVPTVRQRIAIRGLRD